MLRSKLLRRFLPPSWRQGSGLTLVEVMVGLVIFGIVTAAVLGALRQARKMLVEPERKGLAWSQAQSILEKQLAKTYRELSSEASPIPQVDTEYPNCSITVTAKSMEKMGPPELGKAIPYCAIKVDCNYTDDYSQRSVSLSGIVPFPYMQVFNKVTEPPSGSVAATCTVVAATLGPPSTPARCVPGSGASSILEYKFTPVVSSNLMIFYDVSIAVENSAIAIHPTDLLITQGFLNGKAVGIPTGTPVLTQPSIGNVVGVGVADVESGKENTFQIRWRKNNPGGKITLKKANAIILRTENTK